MREMMTSLANAVGGQVQHPLLAVRPVRNVGFLIITADRGLAGSYNSAMLRRATEMLRDYDKNSVKLYVVGRKGIQYFRRRNYNVVEEFGINNTGVTISEAREITKRVRTAFETEEIDQLTLLYTRFFTAITQKPTSVQLLPIQTPEADGAETAPNEEYIFEPDAATLLQGLAATLHRRPSLSGAARIKRQRTRFPHDLHEFRHRQRRENDYHADPAIKPGAAGGHHPRNLRNRRRRRSAEGLIHELHELSRIQTRNFFKSKIRVLIRDNSCNSWLRQMLWQSLPFSKMQGVGNDFVVVDGRARDGVSWDAAAVVLCDRKFGVGADGLLVLDNSDSADFAMRMYNPDGSPDVCGNGLRCIARYAVERGVVSGDAMRIETLVDVRAALIHRDLNDKFESVTVDMGEPRFAARDIPVALENHDADLINYSLPLSGGETLTITALSTGSTHSITFVNELPDDAAFFRISPQVENHPLFPERTSLMWCKAEGRDELRLRIWERGAGETWGCGTGACAAAVAAIQRGHGERNRLVTVASKGGALQVEWKSSGKIVMTGPAEFVF